MTASPGTKPHPHHTTPPGGSLPFGLEKGGRLSSGGSAASGARDSLGGHSASSQTLKKDGGREDEGGHGLFLGEEIIEIMNER